MTAEGVRAHHSYDDFNAYDINLYSEDSDCSSSGFLQPVPSLPGLAEPPLQGGAAVLTQAAGSSGIKLKKQDAGASSSSSSSALSPTKHQAWRQGHMQRVPGKRRTQQPSCVRLLFVGAQGLQLGVFTGLSTQTQLACMLPVLDRIRGLITIAAVEQGFFYTNTAVDGACWLQVLLLGTSCSLSQQQAALQHSTKPAIEQEQERQLRQLFQN